MVSGGGGGGGGDGIAMAALYCGGPSVGSTASCVTSKVPLGRPNRAESRSFPPCEDDEVLQRASTSGEHVATSGRCMVGS